jgi:DNA polymerase-3 subunit gamma/tau
MRDALSLMDRLIATGQSPLSSKILEEMLGLPPAEQVIGLIDALAAGDIGQTLIQTAGLIDGGIAVEQFFDVLIDRFRTLMLIAACGKDSQLVELAEDARQQAAQQAAHFDAAGVVHMIALCENVQRTCKLSSNPRALLDAAMVRLALAEKMADVSAVLQGGSLPGATSGAGAQKKN